MASKHVIARNAITRGFVIVLMDNEGYIETTANSLAIQIGCYGHCGETSMGRRYIRPNHNMPRSAAQLKIQDCLRIGLWRSDALGVFHLSRK